MFLLGPPAEVHLQHIIERAWQLPLSYEPVGLAMQPNPAGFRVDEAHVVLGHGAGVFARAVGALEEWRQFDLGWTRPYPKHVPLEAGAVVAIVVQHLGFWSINTCRIVYRLDGADSGAVGLGTVPGRGDSPRKVAGFAYGTLSEHAEAGEEIFEVSHNLPTDEVIYRIRAVSRERAFLAKIGFPIARALQARFRRDSLSAMLDHVG